MCAALVNPALKPSGNHPGSFASGIPVVSTSLGAEGIAATPGQDLLLADSPQQFAEACLRLLDHPDEAAALAAHARHLVETTYDWSVVGPRLDRIYYELVQRKSGLSGRVSP